MYCSCELVANFDYMYFHKSETLPESEKISRYKRRYKSRYKRSFKINHSQMARFIFMHFFYDLESLKWVKNEYKTFQDKWLFSELYITWKKEVEGKHKVYCKVYMKPFSVSGLSVKPLHVRAKMEELLTKVSSF